MGNIYHANAKTTAKIRTEIQNSQESIARLADRYSLNPKTVHKWKRAGRQTDGVMGPKNIRSSLSAAEQKIICEFRRVSKFSLDDVYLALRDKIPSLTRSNLHRCLKRNGLSVLPVDENAPRTRRKFKKYDIGYVHIDITEVRIAARKCYLFVAIDRICKYAYVELHEQMTAAIACEFLRNVIKDFPHKIHRILTDNGAQFTYALLAEHLRPQRNHPFDVVCSENTIIHKLTKFRHPWTNGQVEVFNKTLKKHTTKTYYYETIEELKRHIMAFMLLYNFQKPLKALKFIPPYASLIEWFKLKPQIFNKNQYHNFVGLNIYSIVLPNNFTSEIFG